MFVFEMTHGFSPFKAENRAMMYEDILVGRKRFISTKSLKLRMLLSNLLQVEVDQRFGSTQVKNDPWFESTNWDTIFWKEAPTPEVNWIEKCYWKPFNNEELDDLEFQKDIDAEMYCNEFKDF